jgi:hypothetical protein
MKNKDLISKKLQKQQAAQLKDVKRRIRKLKKQAKQILGHQ